MVPRTCVGWFAVADTTDGQRLQRLIGGVGFAKRPLKETPETLDYLELLTYLAHVHTMYQSDDDVQHAIPITKVPRKPNLYVSETRQGCKHPFCESGVHSQK